MGGIGPPRPLAAEDDRVSFDCGHAAINHWFSHHALRNQQDDVSRTSILYDTDSQAIAGYVTLAATQIERGFLPKSDQRNRPDPVPALLLAQLAVDRRYQKRGYAQSLIFFAFHTAVQLADHMGCFWVLTHPIDDTVRSFYRSFDFKDLPYDPKGSMAVRIKTLRQNGFGG